MEQAKESIINIIRDLPFFDEFTKEEVTRFARNLSLQHIDEGAFLFREGDVGDYLFFVVEGLVEIIMESSSKTQKIIASYGAGASIGEMALIDEFERSASVRAATDCEILVLTKSRFETTLKDQPEVGTKLLKGLARNISLRLRAQQGKFHDIS